MPCENYREALIEASAVDSAPSPELCSHLDTCASCRAALAEERQLFAAIDTGLRTAANVEAPPSLIARVRAQLNKQPVPQHSWVPIGAAMAASVALVLVIVLARGIGRDPAGANPEVNSIVRNVTPTAIEPTPPADAWLEAVGPPAKNKSSRPIRNARVAQPEELTVLIAAGQKRAIDALLSSAQRGEPKMNFLLSEKSESLLKELQVSPLIISPIEVKPLADLTAEPASEDGETRR
jgi:hypothetical protein